jgi:hypothetical protein
MRHKPPIQHCTKKKECIYTITGGVRCLLQEAAESAALDSPSAAAKDSVTWNLLDSVRPINPGYTVHIRNAVTSPMGRVS